MKKADLRSRIVRVAAMGVLLGWAPVQAQSGDALGVDGSAGPSALGHLLWEQPPIEADPLATSLVFCAWDVPAYAEEMPDALDRLASEPADDFRSLGIMPVTRIHWWGSYQNWQESRPPAVGPDAWRITFWADTPQGPNIPYSRPGTQLHEFEVAPDRVTAEPVGSDRFPDKPSDSCFRYSLTLAPEDVFWPGSYEDTVFWIGITAVYRTQRPEHVWGWKSRPCLWMDGAVAFATQYHAVPSGQAISAIAINLLQGGDGCTPTSKVDLAFALETDPIWIQWELPFLGLREWTGYADEASTARLASASSIAVKSQQKADLGPYGLDVDATQEAPKTWAAEVLADDFQCKVTGPVTQIEVWGSYYLDTPPQGGPTNLAFTLCIHADDPAAGGSLGMPGKVLWTRSFRKGQFKVQETGSERQGYSSPASQSITLNNHNLAFKYTFSIDPSQAFVQTGTSDRPAVYWLSVQANVPQPPGSPARFGWKTSASTWNSDAVWAQGKAPYSGKWQKLNYPGLHPRAGQRTALAFAITTSSLSTDELIDRQVADDWRCDFALPVMAITWWGSYTGYTYRPCACDGFAVPVRPDYFLLSIWSDVPNPDANDPRAFSHPGQKLWEYRATQYEEIMVGFDGSARHLAVAAGQEPVYRYSVGLPEDKAFVPPGAGVYWLSVVAVTAYPTVANYPWGWTNHDPAFGDTAVAGSDVTDSAGHKTWTWQPIRDPNGAHRDQSFIVFQHAQTLGPPPQL
jgi:hypothetical protein